MPLSVPHLFLAGAGLLAAAGTSILVHRHVRRRRDPEQELSRLLERRQVAEAGRLLESLGRAREAVELLLKERRLADAAALCKRCGDLDQAGELFSRIGDHEAATEVFLELRDAGRAAKSLERLHRYAEAAELLEGAGDLRQAVRLYRKARQFRKAGELLRCLGDERGAADLLGRHFEQTGELDRAGDLYVRAGRLRDAGEVFYEAGDFLRAAQASEAAGDVSLAARARLQAGEPLRVAEQLEAAGDLEAAARIYEAEGRWNKVAELHKRRQDWSALGHLMLRVGREDLAIGFLRRVRPGTDGYLEPAMTLAALHEKRGEADDAIRKYSEILNACGVTSDTSPALLALSALCERNRRSQEGITMPAWQAGSGDTVAAKEVEAPAPAAVEAPASAPSFDAVPADSPRRERLNARVDRALARGRLPKARRLLRRVVRENPGDIVSLFRLADVVRKLEDVAGAEAVLGPAGDRFRQAGFLLKAAAVFRKMLELDEDALEPHEALADLYARLGMAREAVAHLRTLVRLHLGRGQIREALPGMSRILALQPGSVEDHLRLAEALARYMMYEEAGRELKEALHLLEARGGDPELWIQLAERYLHLEGQDIEIARQLVERLLARGSYQKALLWLQVCFERRPGDISSLDLLANCFELLGQPDKAVVVLKTLADLCGRQGLLAEREAALRRILGLDPADDTATRALGVGGAGQRMLQGKDPELDWTLPP